jgi:hypothetical protein
MIWSQTSITIIMQVTLGEIAFPNPLKNNGDRSHRTELRVVKRRLKVFSKMQQPHSVLKAKLVA